MRPRNVLILLISLTLALVPLFAAKFWEKKPYTEWKEKECMELLTKSPWTIQYVASDFGVNVNRFGTDGGLGTRGMESQEGQLMGGEREIINMIHFRFVTAQPIKMAMAQLRLLQNPGNEELLKQVQQYVNSPPAQQILVEVNVSGRPPGHHSLRELENFFKVVEFSVLQQDTYLSAANQEIRIPLMAYVKPGTQSRQPMYVFPRFDENGKPHFTGDEDSIVFHTEIDLGLVGGSQVFEVNQKTKTKKLKFNGELTL